MLDTLVSFAARGLTQASWPVWIAYFIAATQLTIFSVTLYLHRSQTHRAVDFHPALAHVFRLWAWLSTAMVTKEWVAIHRKHHARCETEEDPHSPLHKGIRKVVLDGVALYQAESKNPETMIKYGIGTPNDWIERNVYGRFPSLGPTLLLFISIALFGFVGLAIWALQMVWIPFWAAGVVNGLGHWWGYRNFESPDMSTNLTPWGLIIGGEELHNNHHAFPSSAKFALRKFEVDIGWAAIRLFEALGLAKVLRVAASLDVRPNVKLPDVETVKAVLSHRVHVLSDYFKGVIVPTLRDEVGHAGVRMKALPRKLRKGLANGGRWLDAGSRRELDAVVRERPLLATVCEFRSRLAGLLERNGRNADAMKESLKIWCQEAEASGIRTLSEFASRLKGYQLAHSD